MYMICFYEIDIPTPPKVIPMVSMLLRDLARELDTTPQYLLEEFFKSNRYLTEHSMITSLDVKRVVDEIGDDFKLGVYIDREMKEFMSWNLALRLNVLESELRFKAREMRLHYGSTISFEVGVQIAQALGYQVFIT